MSIRFDLGCPVHSLFEVRYQRGKVIPQGPEGEHAWRFMYDSFGPQTRSQHRISSKVVY